MTALSTDDAPPYTPIINMIAAPLGGGIQFVLQEGSANGASFARIVQPQIETSVTERTPSANDVNENTLGSLADLVGLVVINAPYAFDGTNYLRMRGGLASVDNPTLANVAAQDARAFLYAVDRVTPTQAVRLRATAAGLLDVNEAVPVVTTVVDIAMVAATNTLLAAANLNRKEIIIQNISGTPTDINRIGDTNILGNRGIQIVPGQTVRLATTAAIFGRPESGTGPMTVTEIEA